MGSEALWERAQIEAVAQRLKPLWERDPKQLLASAQQRSVEQRYGTDLLQHHIPFFFEVSLLKPGKPSKAGTTLHGYDDQQRLVWVESAKPKGKTRSTVFEPDQSGQIYFVIEASGAQTRVTRVGRTGREANVNYDISLNRAGDTVAYLWEVPPDGRVPGVQIWDLAWPYAETARVDYDASGRPARIERGGQIVWQSRVAAAPAVDLGPLAKCLLELVRQRRPQTPEPVLVLSVCVEANDVRSLPPQIGVVFERDAQAFARDPSSYPDGMNALLIPTLQEDSGFPCGATYPFIEITAADAPAFSGWKADSMLADARQLVRAMNAHTRPDEPPFLLVDMEGEGTQYLSDLPEKARAALASYGIRASV